MLEHPKIKVNPTEVRQEMGHPVRIMHKVRPEDPYLQTSGVRTDGQPPLFVALLHLGETFQEILSISSNINPEFHEENTENFQMFKVATDTKILVLRTRYRT